MNPVHLFLLLFILLVSNKSHGQSLVTTLNKDIYKVDEYVTIIFDVASKVDSFSVFKNTGLKVIKGPNKSEYRYKDKDFYEYTMKVDYTLKPMAMGVIKIIPPTFYFEGKEITGKPVYIEIVDDKLTDDERFQNDFDAFKRGAIKPDSTTRFFIFEDFGYIEVYKDLKWEFLKNLSKTEIAILRDIK